MNEKLDLLLQIFNIAIVLTIVWVEHAIVTPMSASIAWLVARSFFAPLGRSRKCFLLPTRKRITHTQKRQVKTQRGPERTQEERERGRERVKEV